jgi:hypothetical protein
LLGYLIIDENTGQDEYFKWVVIIESKFLLHIAVSPNSGTMFEQFAQTFQKKKLHWNQWKGTFE